jgi:hypothetical protein
MVTAGNPEDPFNTQRVPDENFRRLLKTIGEYPKPEEQALLGCTDCAGVRVGGNCDTGSGSHEMIRDGAKPGITIKNGGDLSTAEGFHNLKVSVLILSAIPYAGGRGVASRRASLPAPAPASGCLRPPRPPSARLRWPPPVRSEVEAAARSPAGRPRRRQRREVRRGRAPSFLGKVQ